MTDYHLRQAQALRQSASLFRRLLSDEIADWRAERLPGMRGYYRALAQDTIKTIRIQEADADKWEAMQ